MRHARSLALAAVFVAPAALPAPGHAGPPVTVYVGPRYYYYRPYPGYYYPGLPIMSSAPTVSQFVPAVAVPVPVATPVGPALAAQGAGLPQNIPPAGNGGMAAIAPFGAPPAPAAGDVEQALQLLASPRERDRMETAVSLGRNKVAKALEPLERTLVNDPSPRVREAAARGLGLLGDRAALKALQNAAQGDDDRDVRHSAQFAAESIRAGSR